MDGQLELLKLVNLTYPQGDVLDFGAVRFLPHSLVRRSFTLVASDAPSKFVVTLANVSSA